VNENNCCVTNPSLTGICFECFLDNGIVNVLIILIFGKALDIMIDCDFHFQHGQPREAMEGLSKSSFVS
jgi:hypothetical protein